METKMRKSGEKFQYKKKVYKTIAVSGALNCTECDLLYCCKDSKPVRGECVALDQKRMYKECSFVGTWLYRLFRI